MPSGESTFPFLCTHQSIAPSVTLFAYSTNLAYHKQRTSLRLGHEGMGQPVYSTIKSFFTSGLASFGWNLKSGETMTFGYELALARW